jgi:hypothetical protein
MYKHQNKGKGIVTLSDDEGNQHIFYPGSTISLNRIYTEAKIYDIFCIDTEKVYVANEKKQIKKKIYGE